MDPNAQPPNAQPPGDQPPGDPAANARPSRDQDPGPREPEGGSAVCYLPQVCPECGRLADDEPPTTCPRCGAAIEIP